MLSRRQDRHPAAARSRQADAQGGGTADLGVAVQMRGHPAMDVHGPHGRLHAQRPQSVPPPVERRSGGFGSGPHQVKRFPALQGADAGDLRGVDGFGPVRSRSRRDPDGRAPPDQRHGDGRGGRDRRRWEQARSRRGQGATENAATVQALLDNLIDRGLATDRVHLFILDGAKALSRAVRNTFGDAAEIQRCQVHKGRNVIERLPKEHHAAAKIALRQAWTLFDPAKAQRLLDNLAKKYDDICPGAARSLREGMPEMLTLIRLGLPKELRKSLASTNIMESVNAVIARASRNVTRWRNASMGLRWTAAGMLMDPAGLPPRQRPHPPSQASRRARQDLRGEDGPQVRAGGRRPTERRAGRVAGQAPPESGAGAGSRPGARNAMRFLTESAI